MAVISASRRTDIPAYHRAWFMDKIKTGYCHVANPFNGRVERVSLATDDMDGIVFWTRNPHPMRHDLPILLDMGYRFYFQFTIIGYPKTIDPGSPTVQQALEYAHELADGFGGRALVWRYDPIALTTITDTQWHIDNFGKIAEQIQGASDTCVISFIDHYRKLDRNFYPLLDKLGASFMAPRRDELSRMAEQLAVIAGENGLRITTCCEPKINATGVAPGPCIDPDRLASLTDHDFSSIAKCPTRPGCLCVQSKDIGAYDTCPAGCAYCYANRSRRISQHNLIVSSASSPALCAAGKEPTIEK